MKAPGADAGSQPLARSGGPLLRATWITIYLVLVLSPMVLAMAGGGAPGGFAWDFAMALGYAAMAMLGIQFVLTARFRYPAAPFGIDIIYYFHRHLAVLAVLLLAVHVAIVVVRYPAAAGPLDPRHAAWPMNAGRVAFLLFLAVAATSLWRRALHLEYDRWRRLHAAMAIVALVATVAHVTPVAGHLDTPLARSGWAGFVLLWLLPVVHVRLLRPWRLLRRPWRVEAVRRERGRSWTLTLAPAGHDGFDFHCGQFAWVTLRASPFALREHPFSIASSPVARGRLAFTVKELGDFTRAIGTIEPGELAYVDGPYGAFSIDRHQQAEGFGFIAGGVGIAPIMSMLRTLAARGDRRPLWLFYGNRRWERVVFREELEALRGRLDLRIVHILGEPPEDWSGETGVLTLAILQRHLPRPCGHLDFFVCGPTPMIRIAERGLVALGVPLRRLHSEIFELA